MSTAVDGAEALRSATETRPDAIVLDINLPVLDGVSVVTARRALDNDVPVCVLSARSSVDDRVAGLEAGADDYLVKPFVLAELWGVGFVFTAAGIALTLLGVIVLLHRLGLLSAQERGKVIDS